MQKILVTGSNGQLGSEIRALAGSYPQYEFIFTDLPELDITNKPALDAFFSTKKVDFVINCAGYTAVDKAESEPALAYLVNATAPALLAQAAVKFHFLLVHISTDYVFSGSKNEPYKETDPPDPVAIYGKSKLSGEQAILESNASSLIIRTSWLYSSFGHNFVKTILHMATERDELKVVYDQVGTPTYAADLATCILEILPRYQKQGTSIYNYSNEGCCSWYDFALAVVEMAGLRCGILPVTTNQYPTKAFRPPYSVLDKASIKTDFNINIPHWKESLQRCIELLIKL